MCENVFFFYESFVKINTRSSKLQAAANPSGAQPYTDSHDEDKAQ